MHKVVGVLAGGFIASLLVGAPATGAASSDSTTSFLFDSGAGKGVVTLTQGAAGTELAFNLYGLKPSTKYRLVVSSQGCDSNSGTMTSRAFRTTSRGSTWDPVTVNSAATPRSARIVRASSGRTVICTNRAHPATSSVKIRNATPGVLAVLQGGDTWRMSLSVGGLRAATKYSMVALEGGCDPSSPVIKRGTFRSTSKGFALVDVRTPALAGSTIGAVAVIQRSTSEVVFCAAV